MWQYDYTPIHSKKSTTRYGGDKLSFSENLAKRMRDGCETKYSLAKAIGVSQSTVSNWLSESNSPQLRNIGLLAAHYGCSTEDMMANSREDST